MKTPINVLIIEDSADDYELLLIELRRGGYDPSSIRVESKESLNKALDDQSWDLILSDYSMPLFDGLAALKIYKEKELDIPFILISGTIGEDVAVAAMKAGAHDYLMKGKLKRLIPAIKREIKEAGIRRQHKQAEKELKQSEERFRTIIEQATDALYIQDFKGNIIEVNHKACESLGYSRSELLSMTIGDITEQYDDIDFREEVIRRLRKGKDTVIENMIKRKNGTTYPVEISLGMIELKDENVIIGFARDITERKRAEEELLKFKLGIERTDDMILMTDLEGNICYVNPAFVKIYGYTEKEALNNTPRILKSDAHSQEFYSEFWAKLLAKEVVSEEIVNKTKDGRLIDIETSANPILDDKENIIGFLAVQRDITDRKRTEQIQKVLYNISNAVNTTDNLDKLIGLTHKELSTIIDTSNFFVALYDQPTDSILVPYSVNEKEEFSEIPVQGSLTGHVIKSGKSLLITQDKLGKRKQMGKIKASGEEAKVWMGVPLKVKGVITGAIVLQHYHNIDAFGPSDLELLEFVSDQISLSIDRKKREDDLKTALIKATESDRLKSAFLATMSHELRTPLNAIIGFSDIITEGMPNEEIIYYINIINSSGQHLLSIVEDIFDITLIESGGTKIKKSEENLHSILQGIHEIIKVEQHNTGKEHIALKLILPFDEANLVINTDPPKLKQILINLLKNAFKFTNEGYIKFGYGIETQDGKQMLEFFVTDTGIGITNEKQKLIFDVFRQIEETDTKSYGGTGIGLTISKKLTELLGGDIRVESEEGKGSTFYFTVPFEGYQVAGKPVETEIIAEKANQFKDATVLIVDDVESSFKLLKKLLEKSGIKTIWAKNGRSAIKFCNENPDIDLVLMDISMPVMDGYEATGIIKKFHPYLPVIAQTAYAAAGDREKSLEAGCDDYIAKPIKKEKLIEMIGKYLGEA